MKKLFFLLISMYWFQANGQLSISNIIFYEPGDTVFQNIDNNPAHVSITPASGTKQTWDFSQLKAVNKRRDTIKGIDKGDTVLKYFPTAVMKQPFQTNGFEYLDLNSTEVKGLGVATNFFGQIFVQPYSGKRIIQFAPISFNTTKTGTSTLNFGFSAANIPFLDSLLKNILPIPGATIDSIRISIVTKTDFTADAFGDVITPYEKVEVLRVKQENRVSSKLEAKAKLGILTFWQDISGLLPIPLPKDTSFVYLFYNNKVKDPVVTINANKNNQPTSTSFRANPTVPQDTVKIDSIKKDTLKTEIIEKFENKQPIQSIVCTEDCIKMIVDADWMDSKLAIFNMNGQMVYTAEQIRVSDFTIPHSKLPFNQALIWKWTKANNHFIEKRMIRDY